MICDDCGKDKEDVEDTICPYEADINEEEVDCRLCEDCYYERSMDI